MLQMEVNIVEYALETLTSILESTGMNQTEIDQLLAKFLQEEAFEYVDFINRSLTEMSLDADVTGMIC